MEKAAMNLDDLNIDQLKTLRRDVDKAIASYDRRLRDDAVSALESKAKEMGFTLSELVDGLDKRKKKVGDVKAKFAHPENSNITWTGRGRKPKWFEEALANGRTPADLEI
jgi:DNA-binding protein H-NS